MTAKTLRAACAAVGLMAVAGLFSLAGSGASASNPRSDTRVGQAESMAVEPAVDRQDPQSVAAERARGTAGAMGARIPLPVGGNLNGIQWEAAGGVFSDSEIEAALEYNAMCQWVRAVRDGRDAETSLEVLRMIPSWPALRGTGAGEFVRQVAAEAQAGGGGAYQGALADCDASQARQVQYAIELGLTPSS
jgi:hypothetical protein